MAAAGNIRIEWNHPGFEAVLSSGPVAGMCAEFGQKYLAKANARLHYRGGQAFGYKGAAHTVGRAIYNVYTLTGEAKIDNSKNNTLAKLMP